MNRASSHTRWFASCETRNWLPGWAEPPGRWWKNNSPGKPPLPSSKELSRTQCAVRRNRLSLERQRNISFQLISLGVRAQVAENLVHPARIADLRHYPDPKWIDELQTCSSYESPSAVVGHDGRYGRAAGD